MSAKGMARRISSVKESTSDSKHTSISGNFEDLYLIRFSRIGIS